MEKITANEARYIIEKAFSLQWCKDNLIAPVFRELPKTPSDRERVIIGVSNMQYLGKVGTFIFRRVTRAGYDCYITETKPENLMRIINEASKAVVNNDYASNLEDFSADAIVEALDKVGEGEFEFDDEEDAEEETSVEDLEADLKSGSKIQQAAATIMIRSFGSGVSDIHIEPRKEEYKVRIRKDGVMEEYISLPKKAGVRLISCLKGMARMDIAERRQSQDGKILRVHNGKPLEFRCSTAPGKYGEKMVMRILNSSSDMLSLEILIGDERIREKFRSMIQQANGIILVSGPTGSGKSTTLASALREKDSGEINIVTAEDPIEYDLGGSIQQFPVLRAKGQSFANLLRTFLRQDPDVILIGETRDSETAEASMDAAETGHLVFTTIHANSATSSLTRLVDMGIPPYKLNTSVRGILAQRLVRKVCQKCAEEVTVTEVEAMEFGIEVGTKVRRERNTIRNAQNANGYCEACNGSGFKGRIGVYELMEMSRDIKKALVDKAEADEIEDIAVNEGMLTLRAYALRLVEEGLTTLSELEKICNND